MKPATCERLPLRPLWGTWFRAIDAEYWGGALGSSHTTGVTSRFNPGGATQVPYEVIYLAENSVVALYEVKAMLGPAERPIPDPRKRKTMVIDVRLQAVADLSDPDQRRSIGMSAQELTGAWKFAHATGEAPTQRLGAALEATVGIEGFVAISAKLPLCATLVVFPHKLQAGSELVFRDAIKAGRTGSRRPALE